MVGTGPFLFKSWEQGQRVTLAKNPNHYDTVPNIDEFVMVVQPETDTLVRSLESNDIDMIEILPAPDTERIQNTDGSDGVRLRHLLGHLLRDEYG